MVSASLTKWQSQRAEELDQLEAAHAAVVGTGRGRRYATEQVNQAYVILLASHFQGFCRDLHAEAVDSMIGTISPPTLRSAVRAAFAWKRALDRGNPHPGAIGEDFNRLGMAFWPAVLAIDARNERRRDCLVDLNAWRNAIAHQDFDPERLGDRVTVTLAMVRRWRSACRALARCFDRVVRHQSRKRRSKSRAGSSKDNASDTART